MKKKTGIVILAVVLVIVMALLVTSCESKEMVALSEENAALQAQIDELNARLAAVDNRPSLAGCTLSGSAWSSNNGATVTMTATPDAYDETHTAAFSIQLNGVEVEFVPCEWNGTAYTATVDLEAANGYGYYFIITTADGNPTRMELNTPSNITDDTLVYMETALNAYADLKVDGWEQKDGKLVITSGFAQVQMPRLTADGEAAYAGSQLVLKCNGEEVLRKPVEIAAGEGIGRYETAVTNLSFDMPELADDSILELWLEATLSGGQTVEHCGCTWTCLDGILTGSVG